MTALEKSVLFYPPLPTFNGQLFGGVQSSPSAEGALRDIYSYS